MSEVLFWSDTHFSHKKVSELRGFDSTEDHDEFLCEKWVKNVRSRDQIILLGDMTVGSAQKMLELVAKLPGTKHLIAGNHDQVHPMHRKSHTAQKKWMEVFDSIQAFDKRKIRGREVLLSHFPFAGDHDGMEDRHLEFRLRLSEIPLIHGHVHDEWKVRDNQINVGVDHWMDGPASVQEIFDLID